MITAPMRHPAEMSGAEVTQFLTSLAVAGHVAASTQNQALSALLFLYREVLEQDFPWLDNVVRAKGAQRLPVVLIRAEVRAVIQQLQGVPRLMALLMYGAGLRLLECARLRVQDVDLASNQIVIRGTPAASGPGSGSSRRPGSAFTRPPGSIAAIISTSPSSSERSRRP
jgi:site-specific recombinase XerD